MKDPDPRVESRRIDEFESEFHDLDDDGKLATNFIGFPKEPYGFSGGREKCCLMPKTIFLPSRQISRRSVFILRTSRGQPGHSMW